MRKVIKFFFISLVFFISLSVNASAGIHNTIPVSYISSTQTRGEISAPIKSDTVIVCQNQTDCKITSSHDKKDNFSSNTFSGVLSNNELLQKSCIKYKSINMCESLYNISPFLKNEICTRAP
jgi:hypothetical protein